VKLAGPGHKQPVAVSYDQHFDFDAEAELAKLLAPRRGHFCFESGHHGNLWLDLEPLFVRPKLVQPLANRLAELIASYDVAAVCGPLSGGAFVAEMIAATLDIEFYFTEPSIGADRETLFPVKYRLPRPLRSMVAGKRVAIANDVINAGSAVRGTYEDLRECAAEVVVVGTLAILGDAAKEYFAERNVPVEWLAEFPNELWLPAECPLCASGVALDDPESPSEPAEARCGSE
jgi:orotate phosphoribosyltransferase